ncbi:uncharacterized protein BO72DRAFT_259898 [Aspergillus fijiensis CBS 313.89]|uniref:Uncharacterized protein n=1 Tax=Aspergillus fijiensis CBS 313.89 TaxID=1448319 RepID=A0A8G1RG73_9EURO|nr:uncharacterized protein BO72DRAFT_259898 [Aspergillus fijiensis CBS 313.89]RAK72755.1 hypothetical protein BO72DRAFT_259898 [Aspergillus fijiensis CBS 313.89]
MRQARRVSTATCTRKIGCRQRTRLTISISHPGTATAPSRPSITRITTNTEEHTTLSPAFLPPPPGTTSFTIRTNSGDSRSGYYSVKLRVPCIRVWCPGSPAPAAIHGISLGKTRDSPHA